ncbi:MAG: extracellular solute-binding protein [Lachnospiraceae bacterium]|nr:extracellular solute-binding protein [Lachnospiraceae bacterium]
MKRKLALLLAFVMMIMAAAGCTTITVNPQQEGEKEEAPAETAEKVPEVEWYISEEPFPDSEMVAEALSAYFLEKLNIKVNIHYVQDYSSIGTALSAGEDRGIVTVGEDINFITYANAGAFYPLEDLLDKYGQGIKALFNDDVWGSMTIDGHIYAIPIKKDNAYIMGIVYNEDLANELGLDMESVHFKNWNDLDEDMLMEAIKKRDELHPEYAGEPLIGSWLTMEVPYFFGLESFLGNNYAVCNIDGYNSVEGFDIDTVFDLYETDEYREFAKKKQRWVANGLQAYDYSKISGFNSSPAVLLVGGWGLVYAPDHLYGENYTSKLILPDEVWADASCYQLGSAICANCKEPEAAMKVLEMINTDPYVATMCRFGIEGVHYTVDENGKMEIAPDNSDPDNRKYYHWYGASIGNLMVVNAPESLTGPDNTLIEKLEYYNTNALNAAHMGFVPDTSNIVNEIAACDNVVDEFTTTLNQGQYESEEAVDAAIDEFIEKLKANGVDKIVEEMQRQINEWKAAN